MLDLLALIVIGFMGLSIGVLFFILLMIYEEHKNGEDYR